MSEWWKAADTELLHALSATQHQLNADYRDLLELIAEVTARRLGSAHGYVTDIELLRATQNISKPDARRRIAAAADVLPGRSPAGQPLPAPLPATATAVAQAAISADHIAVIQATLAGLPPHLEAHRGELEHYLAAHARVRMTA